MGNTVTPCPQNPIDDICERIRAKINELISRNKREEGGGGTHGLEHRFPEQIHGKHGPGTDVWNNHEMQIKNQQKALQRKLEELTKNMCGDPPPGAWTWATRPVPSLKEWIDPTTEALKTGVKVVGKGIATGVILYGIYRVIRFLPSLLPPLWSTIPGNLAVP